MKSYIPNPASGLHVAAMLLGSLPVVFGESSPTKKAEYKFVIVPKVVHPWFDQVNEGAKKAAKMIEDQTGSKVNIDYRAPQSADVVMQNEILERSIATKPDGIAIDLLDGEGNRAVIEEALSRQIPVVVFDSEPPSGMSLTSIGGDFAQQARVAGEKLADSLIRKEKSPSCKGFPPRQITGSGRKLIGKSSRSIRK